MVVLSAFFECLILDTSKFLGSISTTCLGGTWQAVQPEAIFAHLCLGNVFWSRDLCKVNKPRKIMIVVANGFEATTFFDFSVFEEAEFPILKIHISSIAKAFSKVIFQFVVLSLYDCKCDRRFSLILV